MTERIPKQDRGAAWCSPENHVAPALSHLLTGSFHSEQLLFDTLGQASEFTTLRLELDSAGHFVICLENPENAINVPPVRGEYRLDGALLRLMPEHCGPHQVYEVINAGEWGFTAQEHYVKVSQQWQRAASPGHGDLA